MQLALAEPVREEPLAVGEEEARAAQRTRVDRRRDSAPEPVADALGVRVDLAQQAVEEALGVGLADRAATVGQAEEAVGAADRAVVAEGVLGRGVKGWVFGSLRPPNVALRTCAMWMRPRVSATAPKSPFIDAALGKRTVAGCSWSARS